MEEYKKKTNTGDDVFIRVQKVRTPAPGTTPDDGHDHRSHPPTAILFGWLGAKHRNLSKYAGVFEDMGYNTVQLIAPPSVIFAMNPRSPGMFLLSVLRIVAADDRLAKGGIVFMKFSNGGAICAPHLSHMFKGNYGEVIKADDELVVKVVKDSIAAIIFDSSPCYLHVSLGAQAINEGLNIPKGIFRTLLAAAFALLCWLQRIFVCNLPQIFWSGVRSADYLCPEQYLYSTGDHLLDAPRLEALIEERKRIGKEVRVFRVDDADHVLLLRDHNEKYVETVQAVNEWGVNEYRRRVGLKPWTLDQKRSQ